MRETSEEEVARKDAKDAKGCAEDFDWAKEDLDDENHASLISLFI